MADTPPSVRVLLFTWTAARPSCLPPAAPIVSVQGAADGCSTSANNTEFVFLPDSQSLLGVSTMCSMKERVEGHVLASTCEPSYHRGAKNTAMC